MFSGLGLAPLVLIFGVAAGLVWYAGIWLSRSTDVLVTRPHRLVLRMGLDSVAVLVLYVVGIAGLIAVNNS